MAIPADSDSIAQPAEPKLRGLQPLSIISLIAGVLGWWASLRLFLDYTASLKDSSFVPSCDLSAVVSCMQNYGSSYGSLFGFSNTVIGLTLFVIPIVLGVLILAKVKLPGWIYVGYSVGLFGGIVLISYLQFASFTDLKTLCLYCLLIWTVTIPLFWASLGQSLSRQVLTDDPAPPTSFVGGIRTAIVGSWWLFALIHFIAVIAFGELTIGAFSGLISAILD